MSDQTTLSEAASPASAPDGGKGLGAESGSAYPDLDMMKEWAVSLAERIKTVDLAHAENAVAWFQSYARGQIGREYDRRAIENIPTALAMANTQSSELSCGGQRPPTGPAAGYPAAGESNGNPDS